ncbi:methyltransferase family protein [Flagellimonas crocea]|uniref:methyltransferase family protein n=1 Tax=Flagellimonas crocea TaxID=3067311 RepID=UPI00296F40AE|nr:isoprenylcysteine carboxylmethyltransferase family protein [Muricauda sp. DH64]
MKVPPALVMLVFGGSMYVLDRFLPVGEFEFFGKQGLAVFLSGLGVLVILIAMVQFFIFKTTVDPMNPKKSSALVTTGVYKFTRNPMYLGMLLLLLAIGLKLGNAFNTLIAAGFVSFMNRFQIKPEEEVLQEKFGQEYKIYCKLTRRWF